MSQLIARSEIVSRRESSSDRKGRDFTSRSSHCARFPAIGGERLPVSSLFSLLASPFFHDAPSPSRYIFQAVTCCYFWQWLDFALPPFATPNAPAIISRGAIMISNIPSESIWRTQPIRGNMLCRARAFGGVPFFRLMFVIVFHCVVDSSWTEFRVGNHWEAFWKILCGASL